MTHFVKYAHYNQVFSLQSSTLNSSVIFNKSRVLKVDNNLSLYAYGSDHGGGHTSRLLELLTQKLGPISSFTGTYLARKWILNINSTLPTSGMQ